MFTLKLTRLLCDLVIASITLALAGCGTTNMNAVTGEAKSIGQQTTGYSNTDQGTVWNGIPPSHVTLHTDGSFDAISAIQPSTMSLSGDELPFQVFVSSAADYHIDGATFTKDPDGTLVLTVNGFGADRSSVYQQVLVQAQREITAQVESGSITQREGVQAMGLVAQALAELGLKALAPGIPTP